MISKQQFFIQLILELLITCFFIFLTVQLLPIFGWGFSTIFCCVFATFSISNAIQMIHSYLAMRRFIKETAEMIQKKYTLTETEDDDDDSSEE